MVKYIKPIKLLKIKVAFEYILGDSQNKTLFDNISVGDIVIFGSGDTMKYFDQFSNESKQIKVKKLIKIIYFLLVFLLNHFF